MFREHPTLPQTHEQQMENTTTAFRPKTWLLNVTQQAVWKHIMHISSNLTKQRFKNISQAQTMSMMPDRNKSQEQSINNQKGNLKHCWTQTPHVCFTTSFTRFRNSNCELEVESLVVVWNKTSIGSARWIKQITVYVLDPESDSL